MFYDLTHPAPVYECENFNHQRDFISRADADERPLVYFPETAWWLGFDNNMPLVNPITGWSRAHDIKQGLSEYSVEGHITFTSGREWSYWHYDHHLTKLTWDGSMSWGEYVAWIAPLYGTEYADEISRILKAWADLQVQHFYEEDPMRYFYLAGELRQDELGEEAGIVARPPKRVF